MYYGKSKVYFDGSHYIAIPHYTRAIKRGKKKEEEIILVEESFKEGLDFIHKSEPSLSNDNTKVTNENLNKKINNLTKPRIISKKVLFEELYLHFLSLPKTQRKNEIINGMSKYFENEEDCKNYVELNLARKQRNLICRRVRMCRKANLANFNYFCTFTYDNKKHNESSFKNKLKKTFANFSSRKNWKYMGVWERAPETNRLHFHGLFEIPQNTLPGEIIKVKDYSTELRKMQQTFQSTYFNERFGRSDFKEIDEYDNKLGNAIAYLMKYIEKSGEKIVYSKNLPQYFISDILEDDIVCTIGQEDRKLLLFDDFKCLDDGEYVGNVSREVINKMKKAN